MAAAPGSLRIRELKVTGSTSASDFEKLEKLGEGAYGSVWKCQHKPSGIICAIKMVVCEHEDEMADMLKEVDLLKECNSDYVVYYAGSLRVTDPGSGQLSLWIVMEYCSVGSILDCMSICNATLSEKQIGAVVYFTLRALAYIHATKKIHRDIKAGNILLNEQGICKLADFGVGGRIETLKMRNTVIGTPFWMAPEVIKETGHDAKADIWSLGITAIEMAKGEPPYAELHPMRVLFLIPKNAPPTLEGNFSKQFKEFVALCLNKDPDQRPSATELLKHAWLKKARKPSCLKELIDRRQRWLLLVGPDDDDDDSSGPDDDEKSDSEWSWSEEENEPEVVKKPLDTPKAVAQPASSSPSPAPAPAPAPALSTPPPMPAPPAPTSPAVAPASPVAAAAQPSGSALQTVIYPVLGKLLKLHRENEAVMASLAKLKIAFDNAEKAHPGITHQMIASVIDTLGANQRATSST